MPKKLSEIPTSTLIQELVERRVMSVRQAMAVLHPDRNDLAADADRWIKTNPDLYVYLEQAALKLASEKKKFGGRLLSEQARWLLPAKMKSTFKITDHCVPYIVKRLIEKHPHIKEFINTKA